MKRHTIVRILAGIILACFALTCLSALTPEQTEALSILKAKYGNSTTVRFKKSDNVILDNIAFRLAFPELKDIQAAQSKADSLINELEPYLQVSTIAMDSVSCKMNKLNHSESVYDVVYYQRKFGEFSFEGNTPCLRISLQRGQYISIFNSLVYDFKIPKPPYLGNAKAEQIADSTYWEDITIYKQSRDENTLTQHKNSRQIGSISKFPDYKTKEELGLNRQSTTLNVSETRKPDGTEDYRLAYRIVYTDGFVVKVDAKTGDVLYHMNTAAY
jgi:hypothetical protein